MGTNNRSGKIINDNFNLLDSYNLPKIVQGDIIKLKNQTLICGDSLSKEIIDLLPNNIKLLFTSPPYINQRTYHDTCDEKNDFSEVVEKYANKCEFLAINLGLVFERNEVIQWWDSYIKKAKENGLKLMQWMVWDKGSPGNIGQMINMIVPISHEFIFLFGRHKIELNRIVDTKYSWDTRRSKTIRNKDGSSRVIKIQNNSEKRKIFSCLNITKEVDSSDKVLNLHPAKFPIELPETFLKSFLQENELFLDPFVGSGTTLVAGELNNFKGYGIENNPEYCRIIIYRFIKVFNINEIEINGKTIKLDLETFYIQKNNIKKDEFLFEV